MNYRLRITILSSTLLVVIIILIWLISLDLLISIIGTLVATGILTFINLYRRKESFARVLRVWSNRDKLSPSFIDRANSSKRTLFYVGFTFESLFKDHREFLKISLNNKDNIEVRLLMIHPDSPHVNAHQEFTDRDIRRNIFEIVNKRLKSLYEELTPSAQKRLKVRATYYLPRFAARIYDDEIMLLNLYLYGSKAHANPVIEICRDNHEDEFNRILKSLNDLFSIGDDGKALHPNHAIVENGVWHGLSE